MSRPLSSAEQCLKQRCAGFVSEPNKSLLQQMPLWLTGFHLRTHQFCQLRLQSLRNSLCLFSKQAFKYTLLCFLFHKKTRAKETCVNKSGGAPLPMGCQQQQGHHFQISSKLCSKQRGAKQQTQHGKSHWWALLYEKTLPLCPVDAGHAETSQGSICELPPLSHGLFSLNLTQFLYKDQKSALYTSL